jgi:Predicted membrane protein involved in D-alanine export
VVFSSAVFLFGFLPVLFVLYRLVPGIKAKNILLILFSLIFYAFGKLSYIPLLLGSVLVNWGAGRLLGAMKKHRKLVMIAAAVIDIGLLATFKYLNFFIENINAVFGVSIASVSLALPIGISFFTFTGLSYAIEVYRRPQNMSRSFLRVLLYISLFPNLLAGPILSYKVAAPQIDERYTNPELTARGIRRFVLGMAKKVLVADILGGMVDAIFSQNVLDARIAWLAAVAYAIQIYFDFSGYSDMALGLGNMFGFAFPENFNHPYIARSMTDFWKRWHISLTTWFRNYLYMPMVMSKPLQKLYKKWSAKYGRQRANKLSIIIPMTVVWLLTGLWHGASWTYVLWGAWQGLWCALEGVGIIKIDKLEKTVGGRIVGHIYTLLIVLLSEVLFRSGNLVQAGALYTAMFTGWKFTAAGTLLLQKQLSGLAVTCLTVGILGSAAALPWLRAHTGRFGESASYLACAALFVLCVMSMAGSGFAPFIYSRF